MSIVQRAVDSLSTVQNRFTNSTVFLKLILISQELRIAPWINGQNKWSFEKNRKSMSCIILYYYVIIIVLARYKIVKNSNRDEIEYFHETRLHYYKSV